MDAAAGKTHSLAVTDSGQLYAWGFGTGTGLGLPTLEGTPLLVTSMVDQRVVQVSAGDHISACLDEQGNCYTWGGSSGTRRPVRLTIPNKAAEERCAKVVCGGKHSMILTTKNRLLCAGNNEHGQCYPPNLFTPKSEVMEIPCPDSGYVWRDVVCGLKYTLAITTSGNMYIWGTMNKGCLPGSNDEKPLSKLTLLDLPNGVAPSLIKQIFGGSSSWGFLTNAGTVYVQGYNKHGNLGLGDRVNRSSFEQVLPVGSMYFSKVFYGCYNGYLVSGADNSHEYQLMLEQSYQTDLIIRSQGKEHKVHRAILAARSQKIAQALKESSEMDNQTHATLSFERVPDHLMTHILQFIYTNVSLNAPSESTKDGKLLLQVLREEFGFNESARIDHSCVLTAEVNVYYDSIKKLAQDRETLYPDVTIVMDSGDKFRAHKGILSARSEYFKALFRSGLLESTQSEILFSETTPEAFANLLDYIYMGVEKVNAELSVELLILATRIGFSKCKAKLEQTIIENLDISNAVELITVSDICDSPGIKKQCISLIAKNHTDEALRQRILDQCDTETIEEIKQAAERFIKRETNHIEIAKQEKQQQTEQEQYEQKLLHSGRQQLANYGESDAPVVDSILRNRRSTRDNSANCLLM